MRSHAPAANGQSAQGASDTLLPARGAANDPLRQALQTPGRALDTPQRERHETGLAGVQLAPQLPSTSRMSQPGDASERQARDYAAGHSSGAGTARRSAAAPAADFSRVRVHADDAAAESAQRLGARAFTYGEHIVFGRNQYAPEREDGRRLLAHELAHVAQQQASGQHFVAREPLDTYRTDAVNIARSDIEARSGLSYWEQTVLGSFAVVDVNGSLTRGAEERDAVLSLLWQKKPALPLKSAFDQTVAIPARAAVKGSKPVVFRFSYSLPAKQGAKPGVKVQMILEGPAALVSAAADPAAGFTLPSFSASDSGFDTSASDHWHKYPEEQKQLYNWVQAAPKKFDQTVTTQSVVKKKQHHSAIRVKGSKDEQGKVTSLNFTLLSETPLATENPAAGYNTKDAGDLDLDQSRKGKAPLGALHGMDKVPADERMSVKFAIHQYFAKDSVGAEVDIVLPIANTTKNVFYTFRFQPKTRDVEIERIGEQGAKGLYARDADALNIGRAQGYAAASGNETTLKAWLGKRYPAIKVQASNVAGVIVEANKALEKDAGTPAWFTANYGIDVLGATAGETRLQTQHGLSALETTGMKDFAVGDMHKLEYALEPMTDPVLKHLRGVKMVRQDAFMKVSGSGRRRTVSPEPKTSGMAWQKGSDRTVGIFDNSFRNDDFLFTGGTRGLRASSTMTFTHELGHTLESQAGIEAAFKKFIAAKKIKSMTWYAKSKPGTETFPEAFSIYQNDPEWMENNLPELYAWFETLSQTGAPPP